MIYRLEIFLATGKLKMKRYKKTLLEEDVLCATRQFTLIATSKYFMMLVGKQDIILKKV
jgi:hypothetical protein